MIRRLSTPLLAVRDALPMSTPATKKVVYRALVLNLVLVALTIRPWVGPASAVQPSAQPPDGVPGLSSQSQSQHAVTRVASAGQVDINFDDLPQGGTTGVPVTNQYPSATFSSISGYVNYVSTQPSLTSSPPNFICTGPVGGAIDCAHDTIVDFTTPVSGLTFDAIGVNDTGTVANIDVFGTTGLLATVPVVGRASVSTPELQDLSSYSNVTRIRIYNITDAAGIGWDDFIFNQSSTCTGTSNLLGNPGFESPPVGSGGAPPQPVTNGWFAVTSPSGAPAQSTSPVHCGLFAGQVTNGYWVQDAPPAFDPNMPFEFSFWFNASDRHNQVSLIENWRTAPVYLISMGLTATSSSNEFQVLPVVDGRTVNGGPAISANQWHQFDAITQMNGAGQSVQLRVDGVPIASGKFIGQRPTGTTTVVMGAQGGANSIGPTNVSYDDVSLGPIAPSTRVFSTPDVKVVQYIHHLSAAQCARDLVNQIGFGKPQALLACGFLSATANPTPPPRFQDNQSWSSFVNSDEYRGYVHVPPVAITCEAGSVTAIDNMSVNVGTNAISLPTDYSLGYTPGRGLAPGLPAYSAAEPFVSDANGSTVAALFDNAQPFVTVRSNGSVLISYLSASRIATVERYLAAPLLGYDAPYIWTVTQIRADCAGNQNVSVANSEFPTTNLYVNGVLKSWYSQTNLPQFITEGGKTLNPPGVGFLALKPTCGQSITSGSQSLQAQPFPGSCAFTVLAGPYGGATGLYY